MIFPRVPGLVSIVVACYNTAPYVRECLESLRRQTYDKIEVIVVDDGSTDDTASIVEAWMESVGTTDWVQNVMLVRLPRHVGYAGALTTAFFLANGEFIAVQDADDVSLSFRIQKQVDYLKRNADVDLVGTNLDLFDDGNFQARTPANWIEYGEDIRDSSVLSRQAVCISTLLFRGIVFDYVGGLTRHPLGMEDLRFINKCFANGVGINNVPDILYHARCHPGQRCRRIDALLHDKSR